MRSLLPTPVSAPVLPRDIRPEPPRNSSRSSPNVTSPLLITSLALGPTASRLFLLQPLLRPPLGGRFFVQIRLIETQTKRFKP